VWVDYVPTIIGISFSTHPCYMERVKEVMGLLVNSRVAAINERCCPSADEIEN
jgi:hypothetical protein